MTVCWRQSATLEFGDFPVAIGCHEAVKCPVKPPTRLCSRRDTVPETTQTKAKSSFCVSSVTFDPPSVGTDLGLDHSVTLTPHLFDDVAHINLQTEQTLQ